MSPVWSKRLSLSERFKWKFWTKPWIRKRPAGFANSIFSLRYCWYRHNSTLLFTVVVTLVFCFLVFFHPFVGLILYSFFWSLTCFVLLIFLHFFSIVKCKKIFVGYLDCFLQEFTISLDKTWLPNYEQRYLFLKCMRNKCTWTNHLVLILQFSFSLTPFRNVAELWP